MRWAELTGRLRNRLTGDLPRPYVEKGAAFHTLFRCITVLPR